MRYKKTNIVILTSFLQYCLNVSNASRSFSSKYFLYKISHSAHELKVLLTFTSASAILLSHNLLPVIAWINRKRSILFALIFLISSSSPPTLYTETILSKAILLNPTIYPSKSSIFWTKVLSHSGSIYS